VSADSAGAAIAADRPLDPTPLPGTAADHGLRALDGDPVRVAIVGATGYVGAELVRLLARHPNVAIVARGIGTRGRSLAGIHPTWRPRACLFTTQSLTMPRPPSLCRTACGRGSTSSSSPLTVTTRPDFRLRDPEDYPRWCHRPPR
jgi:N-acetyl-gamma-glutamylphosphate reductase